MQPYLIFFISWLIPGFGHLLQKKRTKGLVFFVAILLIVATGIWMEGGFYKTKPLHPLMILGFIGDFGIGIFFFLLKWLGFAEGNIKAVTFQYGNAYLAIAGLLNYLIALNAFDIAKGRRK